MKQISAAQAAELIKNGDTVFLGGFGGCGIAESVIEAIRAEAEDATDTTEPQSLKDKQKAEEITEPEDMGNDDESDEDDPASEEDFGEDEGDEESEEDEDSSDEPDDEDGEEDEAAVRSRGGAGGEGDDLTAEERELMNMPDEEI